MDGRQVDCGALVPFKQLSFLLNPQFTLVFFDTMVKICRFGVTIIDIFSSSLLPKTLSSSSQCSQLTAPSSSSQWSSVSSAPVVSILGVYVFNQHRIWRILEENFWGLFTNGNNDNNTVNDIGINIDINNDIDNHINIVIDNDINSDIDTDNNSSGNMKNPWEKWWRRKTMKNSQEKWWWRSSCWTWHAPQSSHRCSSPPCTTSNQTSNSPLCATIILTKTWATNTKSEWLSASKNGHWTIYHKFSWIQRCTIYHKLLP